MLYNSLYSLAYILIPTRILVLLLVAFCQLVINEYVMSCHFKTFKRVALFVKKTQLLDDVHAFLRRAVIATGSKAP